MQAALQREGRLEIPASSVVQFGRCSGGNDVSGRRGTGEESERRENTGNNRLWESLKNGDHRGCGCRCRRLHQLYGDVGRCAERAVCMGVAAIGVGVRDLSGPGHEDQKDAKQREENSPRCACVLPVSSAHCNPLYRRVERCGIGLKKIWWMV